MVSAPPGDPTDKGGLEAKLQRCEEFLRKLELKYTLYFNLQRSRPPLELRVAVERIIKRRERVSTEVSIASYRFSTLVQRFRTYATPQNCGIRACEESRPGFFQGLRTGRCRTAVWGGRGDRGRERSATGPDAERHPGQSKSVYSPSARVTAPACGPFGPSTISNSTP